MLKLLLSVSTIWKVDRTEPSISSDWYRHLRNTFLFFLPAGLRTRQNKSASKRYYSDLYLNKRISNGGSCYIRLSPFLVSKLNRFCHPRTSSKNAIMKRNPLHREIKLSFLLEYCSLKCYTHSLDTLEWSMQEISTRYQRVLDLVQNL